MLNQILKTKTNFWKNLFLTFLKKKKIDYKNSNIFFNKDENCDKEK